MFILDMLFPKRCVSCGRLGAYVCGSCMRSARRIKDTDAICPICGRPGMDGATHPRCTNRYALDGLTSFYRYEGVIRKAIKVIKYRLVSDAAPFLITSQPVSAFARVPAVRRAVIVPVPLHASRLRERGFNQAEHLAYTLGKTLDLPVSTGVLVRVKRTVPQASIQDKATRRANMRGAFAVTPGACAPETILLVDDVFTTGTTMREAANVLKRGGAKFVWAVTIAR